MDRETKRAIAGGAFACLAPSAILVVCGALLIALFPSCEFPSLGGGDGALFSGDCASTSWRLHRAVRSGDPEEVERVLAEGAEPDELDASANTPLGCLLAAPGSPVGRGPGEPHLNEFQQARSASITRSLLDAGADPNAISGRGAFAESPLGLAIRRNQPDSATVLLDHGADPSLEDCVGVPLVDAAHERRQFDELLTHGANPNGTGPSVPLLRLVERGDPTLVDALFSHGADLGRPSRSDAGLTVGDEALFTAAQGINPDMTRMLLAHGALVTDPLRPRLGPAAVAGFNPDNLAALLEAGLDPDAGTATRAEWTSLGEAAWGTSTLTVNVDWSSGRLSMPSPASRAIEFAMPDAAPSTTTSAQPPLADCAIDPVTSEQPDDQRRRAYPIVPADPVAVRPMPPIAVALMNVTTDDLTVLLDHGADPNIVILDRFTPLELAALDCNVEAAAMLLDHGADPTLAPGGRRAADVACPAVAELLA